MANSHLQTSVTVRSENNCGTQADFVYDPVGGDLFTASLRSINFEGSILVIGFADGTIPQILANHLLVKNVDIIGLNWPAYLERNPKVLRASRQNRDH